MENCVKIQLLNIFTKSSIVDVRQGSEYAPTVTVWNVSKYGVFSVFSRIRTEYGEIRISLRIQSECGKIWTKKNSVFGHFSRSEWYSTIIVPWETFGGLLLWQRPMLQLYFFLLYNWLQSARKLYIWNISWPCEPSLQRLFWFKMFKDMGKSVPYIVPYS